MSVLPQLRVLSGVCMITVIAEEKFLLAPVPLRGVPHVPFLFGF